ncbi:hypothetical protein P7E30_16535 [Enterococcus gallinarum]|uniref:Uncharacterized protein n=1 Tax=Enterococcus gallinarum TaxID=1353 RepID=A0AAE4HRM1_ENTGA|nr:hypothetical protein [Enterococcus gallinarum]
MADELFLLWGAAPIPVFEKNDFSFLFFGFKKSFTASNFFLFFSKIFPTK